MVLEEVGNQCSVDNRVTVRDHQRQFEISNDSRKGPTFLLLRMNDLVEAKLPQCKPNGQIFFSLAADTIANMIPFDQIEASMSVALAISVNRISGYNEMESIRVAATDEFCLANTQWATMAASRSLTVYFAYQTQPDRHP